MDETKKHRKVISIANAGFLEAEIEFLKSKWNLNASEAIRKAVHESYQKEFLPQI